MILIDASVVFGQGHVLLAIGHVKDATGATIVDVTIFEIRQEGRGRCRRVLIGPEPAQADYSLKVDRDLDSFG